MEQSHLDSLARMGHSMDAEYLKPWAEELGAFLINFGGIEILTYRYFVLLESDDKALEKYFGLLLGPRIDQIIVLLTKATYLPEAERQLAIRDWTEIRKMTEWRNHVAHNPVFPYWEADKDPATDPPDGVTMPDIRDLPRGVPGVHVTLKLLQELVGVSANLSRRLAETANGFGKDEQAGR